MDNPLARLPSLDLLRGFVAVARRGSVTQAAADLFLTQSAISRQIRGLEEHLGLPLFHRRHRALELTADGERLFRLADAWLTQLGEHLESLRQRATEHPVTLTSTIGLISLWLLPRLGDFQAAQPGVDVRVSAGNRAVDLEREAVDVAMRYGPAERAPEGAVRLFDEEIVAVASPSLGLLPELERNDFSRLTLLEYDELARPWLRWADWAAPLGIKQLKPRARLGFNQYDQVIFAALAGHGLALGRWPLVAQQVADGRLVALRTIGHPMAADFAYWLIQRRGGDTPARQQLIQWLCDEAARTRALRATLG
ncbi:LysR substrate-binding domain-containing protein [Aquabacterium sp.]|uniref:LysR substrate-binding domain-containing protein n=1 Tax=Aquabacterium sp. TaxID=1872578 RepID=UPI002C312B0A|nr:LysR substrate-binding domain-containing protein [Aquabacterium sp.]HSW06249.1 LysR substrate-binding domain-containing protein [Aquabacterium sp.]